MFKYYKASDKELQVTDYPYGFLFIAIFIFGITLYNALFNNLNFVLVLIGSVIPAVWSLILFRRETNINLQTHQVSHTEYNMFSKQHTTMQIQDLKVYKHSGFKGYKVIEEIIIKDKIKQITVVGADFIGNNPKEELYQQLKQLLESK